MIDIPGVFDIYFIIQLQFLEGCKLLEATKSLNDLKFLKQINHWRIKMSKTRIEKVISHSRSRCDDNILAQMMSWYGLK